MHGLVEHLELPPFHLVAMASGGFAGIDYAVSHPDRVRSLVAAATTGGFEEPDIRTFREHAAIPAIERPAPAVYREVSAGYRGSNPEGTQRWIEREEAARQPGAPDQRPSSPNTYAKLGGLTAPLLVVAGGADLISPPELMRTWARHAPPHEFAIIAEAGHSLSYEQPAEFNRIVLEFLGAH
ncbi:alpha/beta fold hydrolase [Pseudonocardia sp. DLS-67]